MAVSFAKLPKLLRKSRFSKRHGVCGTNARDYALNLADALLDAAYWAELGGTSSPRHRRPGQKPK